MWIIYPISLIYRLTVQISIKNFFINNIYVSYSFNWFYYFCLLITSSIFSSVMIYIFYRTALVLNLLLFAYILKSLRKVNNYTGFGWVEELWCLQSIKPYQNFRKYKRFISGFLSFICIFFQNKLNEIVRFQKYRTGIKILSIYQITIHDS